MGWRMFSLIFFTSLYFGFVTSQLPPLTIEALSPRGIKIKMPDDGYSSFTIVAYLRRGQQTRQWQVIVPKPKGGFWTSVDRNFDLRLGDIVSYRIIVNKNNNPIHATGVWTVNEFVPDTEHLNCVISETTTPCSNTICKNSLIFNEEFNNNVHKWKTDVMFPQEPDYPFNAYVAEAIRIENGTLIIKPQKYIHDDDSWNMGRSCTGEFGTRECVQTPSGAQILPPVISGKISTKGLFSFKYGRIDVRAKLPVGDWLIPEINLEPLNHEYGKFHYASGLMRIAFVKGNHEYSRDLYGGAIVTDTEPLRSLFMKHYNSFINWNNDFHVYSLIWKPGSFQLLVDNARYGVYDFESSHGYEYNINDIPHAERWVNDYAPLDQMFYISLGVRVGGIHDFEDTPFKPWKNGNSKAMYKFWLSTQSWYASWVSPELVVDYVRVYAL